MSRKRILITGGAGFVGFHLTRQLLAEGNCDILSVDNFSRGRMDAELDALLGNPAVKVHTADLTQPNALDSLGSGFDEVFHLAAVIGVKNVLERPQQVVRVNSLSTIFLLDWASRQAHRPRVLFSSTSEAYAWTKTFHDLPVPTPEDVPLALTDLKNPRASYAGSKIFGELAFHHYGRYFGIPYGIVRYHNVYGPRMGWDHVIPELHERVRAGQNPLVVYSAHHRRAFCYVADAIDATIRTLRQSTPENCVFNVGNDREEYSIEELARMIIRLAGRNGVELKNQAAANDPIARRAPDISRARRLLGFDPAVTLEKGLTETLAWYDRNPRPSS